MIINPESMLLVFAMEEESANLFDEYRVLYTGLGKIQAALSLADALTKNRPEIVINMGTAGSKDHPPGSIANPTSFVQRDMDVTALGFEPYQTPFSSIAILLENGIKVDALAQAVCGTGDNFSVQETFGGGAYDVVDMEAYALAIVCQRHEVPFMCLKYISDGADGEADEDWSSSLKTTSLALKQALDQHVLG